MNNLMSTKRKILVSAVGLFASKGYTETSVRDIATAVGIKPASLYNHFSSKEDILASILDDYTNKARGIVNNPEMLSIIQENPTAECLVDYMQLNFPMLKDDYYSKVLHVINHEHHRNENVRNLVVETMLNVEKSVERIFVELKKLNIIRHDAEPDYWKKIASSLMYTFSNRSMMGIGHDSADYTGMDLEELLHYMFDIVLKMYKQPPKTPKSRLAPDPKAELT